MIERRRAPMFLYGLALAMIAASVSNVAKSYGFDVVVAIAWSSYGFIMGSMVSKRNAIAAASPNNATFPS